MGKKEREREKSTYLCRDSGKVAKGKGIYQPDADHKSREGHLARCNNRHFNNEVRLFRNLSNPVSGQKESTQASCYCGHQDTEPGRYIVNSLQYIESQYRFWKICILIHIFNIKLAHMFCLILSSSEPAIILDPKLTAPFTPILNQ